MHFLPVSLYRGPFGGPVGKVGAEIALFAKCGKYQGALGPFLSERGPSGPFIKIKKCTRPLAMGEKKTVEGTQNEYLGIWVLN